MAMTKAERRELHDARHRAALHRALRWSDADPNELLPDLPIPPPGEHTQGWSFYPGSEWVVVERRWSESDCHGSLDWTPPSRSRRATQGGEALYSTEGRALRALRAIREYEYASKLLAIDHKIAACRKGST